MGRKPPHPIRSDCSLSQAAFLAYPVQLTVPSNQLTSWSELFPNLGTAARDSEACRGAIQIVRIHFPPGESPRTIGPARAGAGGIKFALGGGRVRLRKENHVVRQSAPAGPPYWRGALR